MRSRRRHRFAPECAARAENVAVAGALRRGANRYPLLFVLNTQGGLDLDPPASGDTIEIPVERKDSLERVHLDHCRVEGIAYRKRSDGIHQFSRPIHDLSGHRKHFRKQLARRQIDLSTVLPVVQGNEAANDFLEDFGIQAASIWPAATLLRNATATPLLGCSAPAACIGTLESTKITEAGQSRQQTPAPFPRGFPPAGTDLPAPQRRRREPLGWRDRTGSGRRRGSARPHQSRAAKPTGSVADRGPAGTGLDCRPLDQLHINMVHDQYATASKDA